METTIPTYLLLVLRGLEALVLEEIHQKLEVVHLEVFSIEEDERYPHINVLQGAAGVGRMLLQTTSSAEQVRSLQSVQVTLAFLARSDCIEVMSKKGVDQIGELVMQAEWEPALQLWRNHMRVIRGEDPKREATPLFRGSSVRDGRHKFSSVDVAGEVGARVIEKFGWPVDLAHFDLEVVCILFHHYMIIGISLEDPVKIQFRNRLANEDRSVCANSKFVSTLRPSTAYLMLRLSEYEAGDVLLDSMCGVGTIPICTAAFTNDSTFCIGGELEDLPMEMATENINNCTHNADLCQWDSTRLPLRNESITRVIIDLPFGVRCGNPRLHSKIYPKIMKELNRVMQPQSRAVLLTSLKKTFLSSIADVPFTLVNTFDVNLGGLMGAIYVLDKSLSK